MSPLLLTYDMHGQRAASLRVDHALDRLRMSFVLAAPTKKRGAMKPEKGRQYEKLDDSSPSYRRVRIHMRIGRRYWV
jgi:hypothetical protein